MRYMVEAMNRRLSYLIGTNYQIGHKYFEPLREDKSIQKLGSIMYERILPMMLTWFQNAKEQGLYNDAPYEGVRLGFGDNK